MILEHPLTVDATDIEQAVRNAETIFPSKWLSAQNALAPNDPLLTHLIPSSTPRQALHGIRQGFPGKMHRLAEAILVGKTIIDCNRKNGQVPLSRSIPLLFSLNDVAKAASDIPNSDHRIRNLVKPNWKSSLYELLVAASYINWARPGFLTEGSSHTPDLKLSLEFPVYVECKARLSHEERVVNFISNWRCGPLTKLIDFLSKVSNAGFLVNIRVQENTNLSSIPGIVKKMVTEGKFVRDIPGGEISIQRYEFNEVSLSQPIPMSDELWKRLFGFTGKKEWHDIFEGGDFVMSNQSNLIIEKALCPLLICIRADHLAGNTPKVFNALKYACSKQFKKHNPGIIHVLLNTKQFGLGELSEFEPICGHLSNLVESLFANYSRVWKILFDIVTPPELGDYFGNVRRVGFTNGRCDGPQDWQKDPGAILIW